MKKIKQRALFNVPLPTLKKLPKKSSSKEEKPDKRQEKKRGLHDLSLHPRKKTGRKTNSLLTEQASWRERLLHNPRGAIDEIFQILTAAPSKQDINRAKRESDKDYEQAIRSAVVQIRKEVCARLNQGRFFDEIQRFLDEFRPETEEGRIDIPILGRGIFWLYSALAWEHYHTEGESIALVELPLLFHVNCEFFLGQRWIQTLLSAWRQQGDDKKIRRVFFGAEGKGRNSYQRVTEDAQRNRKVIAHISNLRARGVGYNEAIRQTQANLRTLGITASITRRTIRAIFERARKGHDPFDQWYSISALCSSLPTQPRH
jgi:hypothetical protein